MLFRKKNPSSGQTFTNFSKFLCNEIMDISSSFNRCDIITNQYFKEYLEGGTWIVDLEQGPLSYLIIPLRFLHIWWFLWDSSKFHQQIPMYTVQNEPQEVLTNKLLVHQEGQQSILCYILWFHYLQQWSGFVRHRHKQIEQPRSRSRNCSPC